MSDWQQGRYCSYCGHPFDIHQEWPRRCRRCHNVSYRNPLPVTVVLLPVEDGILVIRRNIEPGRGKLALPGGFIELPESWQEAGARELREETGIAIEPEHLDVYRVYSAPDGTLLIFGLAPPWLGPLPPFDGDEESSARLIIREPQPMAFSLHTRVLHEYFQKESERDRRRDR